MKRGWAPRRRLSGFRLQAKYRRATELRIKAGDSFSIINNPIETLETFQNLTEAVVKSKRPVYFDVRDSRTVTIDALLYLLALTNAFRSFGFDYAIRGNLPSDPEAKKIFLESGIYRYFESNSAPLKSNSQCVQVFAGFNADPRIAKKLCQFAMARLGVGKVATRGLYDIVMEIILNTVQHAYDKRPDHQKWFAYARYEAESESIRFTILDSGLGIPQTVRRSFVEHFQQLVKLFGIESPNLDSELIKSALAGEFRTKTQQAYRGKGIPRINSYETSGYIKALTIVSNQGYVSPAGSVSYALPYGFLGTLYSWRMTK